MTNSQKSPMSFDNEEVLCDELKMYYEPAGDGCPYPMIRHPLVYSVPHSGTPDTPGWMNAMCNQGLKIKRAEVKAAWKDGNWDKYLGYHERAYRFEALMRIADKTGALQIKSATPSQWGAKRQRQFVKLAEYVWIDSENIQQYMDEWMDILRWLWVTGQKFCDDSDAWEALPDVLTIYRGQDELSLDISWSLDEKVAKWFAKRWSKTGWVKRATVNKLEVIGFLTGRGESEILVIPDKLQDIVVLE